MKKFSYILVFALSAAACTLYAKYLKMQKKKFGEELEASLQSDFDILDEML